MDISDHKRWVRAVILVGVVYAVVGIMLGVFAGWAVSNQGRVAWRLAAWVISGVAFVAHIGYERLRLRNSTLTTALHAAMAAGVGAFGLAVAANVHERLVTSSPRGLIAFALVAWPMLAGVPAFVVAWVVAAAVGLSSAARRPPH